MDNKNLFSIGEIAKAVGVTRKTILNYEVKGLITPDKKEGNTGNRYYTIDTFTQIRTIRVFQNLGLSLDEIREYFNDNSREITSERGKGIVGLLVLIGLVIYGIVV